MAAGSESRALLEAAAPHRPRREDYLRPMNPPRLRPQMWRPRQFRQRTLHRSPDSLPRKIRSKDRSLHRRLRQDPGHLVLPQRVLPSFQAQEEEDKLLEKIQMSRLSSFSAFIKGFQ